MVLTCKYIHEITGKKNTKKNKKIRVWRYDSSRDGTKTGIILQCTLGEEDKRFFSSCAKEVVYIASFMHNFFSEIEWTCQNY